MSKTTTKENQLPRFIGRLPPPIAGPRGNARHLREQSAARSRHTQAHLATTGQVFWSGSERDIPKVAREMNERAK